MYSSNTGRRNGIFFVIHYSPTLKSISYFVRFNPSLKCEPLVNLQNLILKNSTDSGITRGVNYLHTYTAKLSGN